MNTGIRVELVYDPDCPNVGGARAALLRAFARAGRRPVWTEWDLASAASPARVRGYGSPTILVDGRDVASETAGEGARSCRLYRDSGGALAGVPPVAQIVAALSGPTASAPEGGAPGWRSAAAMSPGIAFAALPKLACPACWPAYSGLLGSLGLGFLLDTAYLLPLTAAFLALAVGGLALRARTRRGYGPLVLGLAAAGVILAAKFAIASDPSMYAGIAALIGASVWNALPKRRRASSCPACLRQDGATET